MQIVEMVQKVLETGTLPMKLERQMQNLLQGRELSEAEMAAIDQLINALCEGTIQSVSDLTDEDEREKR
jgi:polyhydroxyalkanoate synthesis regulator phasin